MMFVISAVVVEALFVLFWVFVLAPRLEAEMTSDINSLAQAQVIDLANALSEKEARRETVVNLIDNMLLLKDSSTGIPFFLGVELIIDYDALKVAEGSFDIVRWHSSVETPEDQQLLDVEIPIFNRSSKELIGIARFHGSIAFFEQLKQDVMRYFFVVTGLIMAMLFACWLLLVVLLRPLNRLAETLGARKVDDMTALPPLNGWKSKEILLVKDSLSSLLQRIKEYTEGLEELNIILSTQQETSLDGILVLDKEDNILSINRRFVEMWHIPDHVLAAKSSMRIGEHVLSQLVSPEQSKARLEELQKNTGAQSQREICLADGRTFERYSSPMIGEDNKYYGRVWYVHDVTAYKLSEERYRRLNEELEERVRNRTAQLENTNKELEAFSYSVSHDLRAPLRHIDGFSLALLEDYEVQLDQEAKSYLQLIRESCSLMGNLIDDMLMLSRIGRQKLARSEVDMSHIAREIAAGLQEDEPARNAVIAVPSGLKVMGDERLLRIMLDNLFGNAWKFSRIREKTEIAFGELAPSEIEKMGHQGKKVFFVRDNGAGFDMNSADKLFGAFQRLHSKDEFEGTGIGLATVQRIVNRHGGRIWAESEAGKGATFYFYID